MAEKGKKYEEGTKHDQEKVRMDLVDMWFVEGIAKVLTFGAKKYNPYNWRGLDPERVYAALLRHICARRKGELVDPETGLSHDYHAAANLMFLDYLERHKK